MLPQWDNKYLWPMVDTWTSGVRSFRCDLILIKKLL
jgi:hypothetical protein